MMTMMMTTCMNETSSYKDMGNISIIPEEEKLLKQMLNRIVCMRFDIAFVSVYMDDNHIKVFPGRKVPDHMVET